MQKIEEDFNTSLDNIMLILECEDSIVAKALKKKYGTSLKGSGAKNLTMNTRKMLSCVEDLVKIDTLIIKKFNNELSNVSDFLKSSNILEKLAYAYDLSMEEVLSFYKFPLKIKELFNCFFGINHEKMSLEEMSDKFDLEETEILNLITVNLKQILRYINCQVAKRNMIDQKEETENKCNVNLPFYFMKTYIKKGYKQSEIINALNLSGSEVRQILYKLYGRNYSGILKQKVYISSEDKQLINELINGENNIENTINAMRNSVILPEGFDQTSFNLKEYYISQGFTPEEFLSAFLYLSKIDLPFIKQFYDAYFRLNIRAILNDDEKEILYKLCFDKNYGIYKNLIEKRKQDFSNEYVNDIIEFYKNMGFSSQSIMEAYFKLNAVTLQELRAVYNGNLQLHRSIPENLARKKRIICTIAAPKAGFSQYLASVYDKSRPLPIVKINESDSALNSVFSVYIFFGLKGIFTDIIEEAISYLSLDYKKAYKNYYTQQGLRREDCKEQEISAKDLLIEIGNNINNIEKIRKQKNDETYEKTIGASTSVLMSLGLSEKTSLLVIKELKTSALDSLVTLVTNKSSKDLSYQNGECVLLKCLINADILENITNLKEFFRSFGFSDNTLNKFDNITKLLSEIGELKEKEFLADVLTGNININDLNQHQLENLMYWVKNISEYLIKYERENNVDSQINEYTDLYNYFSAILHQSILTTKRVISETKKSEIDYYYLIIASKYRYLNTITTDNMNISNLIYLKRLKSSFDIFLERYKKYVVYGEIEKKLKKIKKIG